MNKETAIQSLVQPLFDGPLDIVGDVHGEIVALRSLLQHLGYDRNGQHPDGRRLVFLGDLTDRGPDSPAVVDLVSALVEAGQAQCVMGNHELNLLLDQYKKENKWFYGDEFLDEEGQVAPQVLADAAIRQRILDFFGTLPLALERADVRVVHACWDPPMIDVAKGASDATKLYDSHRGRIKNEIADQQLDKIDTGLKHQNLNPVKRLTSGPEERTDSPVHSGGRLRDEKRVFWWNDYGEQPFCFFGHYSMLDGDPRGSEFAYCVDFGVGKRWVERRAGKKDGFKYRLGALRFPEMQLVFDDGEVREAC